jgi:hypothetical protein
MFTLNLNLKPKTMETNSISDVFAHWDIVPDWDDVRCDNYRVEA